MKNPTKIAVISNNSLRYSPYVSFYSELLEKNGFEYIIVNKENADYSENNRHHVFKQTKDMLTHSKFKRTIAWYRFVYNEIKDNNVNKVIVTPTRTALILFPMLLFKKGHFIFDIRDYTNENSFVYRTIEKILLSLSGLVVISSSGFKHWLPKTSTPIVTVHNMPLNATLGSFVERKEERRLRIAYIGLLGYFEINKSLIKKLKDDDVYELQYSGSGDSRIQEYSNEINAANVYFTGSFCNEDKKKLYENVDMINAIYGNDSLIVTTALPNKLYDAIMYRKPIIASKGTYLGELVEENHIGIAIDVEKDNIKNELNAFWQRFDKEEFVSNCDRMYKNVLKEQNGTIEAILEWCKK